MPQIHVSLDLMEYIEQQVLPRYAAFDKAHDMTHVTRVIRRSLELARQMGADLDMSYAIAAYHDLGMEGPRAIHHVTSGKILMADSKLRKWFTPTQLTMMKEAVEDHRASAAKAPRSIYGKIVAEADRDLDPNTVIQRTIDFGRAQHPEYDKEQHWQRFMEHMNNKYSLHGYIRLWIPGSKNEQNLKELRELIAHPEQMRQRFDKLF
ncbi:MAG: HD domain-containing protein [Prevotella sp.]|nr:HD domain-containing protein [Prevotella sp.]